jgi:tripartite-type tricarboxylate transporter receptor subunit TctC
MFKTVSHVAKAISVLAFAASSAFAQNYPERSVRMVIPFAPGGGSDLHARALANELGKLWNQSVIP